MKISIIYWSGTGNTEKMAELIAQGARENGAQVALKAVADASANDVTDAELVALGCSSMGDEVLEESEFEPFVESVLDKVAGKKLTLFGSYGWGDGQWMRDWVQRMKAAGAILADEGLIVNETPQGDAEEACRQYGAALTER